MATAAERKRRSRAHLSGDHSLCDLARCDGTAGVTVEAEGTQVEPSQLPETVTELRAVDAGAETDEAEPGEIEVEVRALVADLKFEPSDPRRILGRIAVRLARRVDQSGAAPAAIRELRVLLAQISEVPDQPAGPLDATRARRATRRIGNLLSAVG